MHVFPDHARPVPRRAPFQVGDDGLVPVFGRRVVEDFQHDDGDNLPAVSKRAIHEIRDQGEPEFPTLHEGVETAGQGKVTDRHIKFLQDPGGHVNSTRKQIVLQEAVPTKREEIHKGVRSTANGVGVRVKVQQDIRRTASTESAGKGKGVHKGLHLVGGEKRGGVCQALKREPNILGASIRQAFNQASARPSPVKQRKVTNEKDPQNIHQRLAPRVVRQSLPLTEQAHLLDIVPPQIRPPQYRQILY